MQLYTIKDLIAWHMQKFFVTLMKWKPWNRLYWSAKHQSKALSLWCGELKTNARITQHRSPTHHNIQYGLRVKRLLKQCLSGKRIRCSSKIRPKSSVWLPIFIHPSSPLHTKNLEVTSLVLPDFWTIRRNAQFANLQTSYTNITMLIKDIHSTVNFFFFSLVYCCCCQIFSSHI